MVDSHVIRWSMETLQLRLGKTVVEVGAGLWDRGPPESRCGPVKALGLGPHVCSSVHGAMMHRYAYHKLHSCNGCVSFGFIFRTKAAPRPGASAILIVKYNEQGRY